MQVLADLQQAIACLSAYLGLTPVASTLSSFPHGATGFPIVLSPPPRAPSDSKRATGEALNPVLIKGALVAPSPVAEAEAQGGGRKGDAATGQTIAKLPLPLPRATSAPDTRPMMRKSKQPWVRYAAEIWDLMKKDPIWLATPQRTDFPSLTHEDVVPHEGASPPAAMRASSALHGAASLPCVAPTVSERGVWGWWRLRRGSRAQSAASGWDDGGFEEGRAPRLWLRRGIVADSKRATRPAGGCRGGQRRPR
ncbi:hypothetical protein GUJ93_ZPchr0016g2535 [Zizania palustris]|uniref:Uncharacterized protein n=1 Tax=Zizania palustris TaxID=103762 RepID=A0A8J5SZ38_ZIZPA|nr:hypothetical protein GUJ93_ZPchr0016g2535 [Zizania palustris]